MKLWNDVRQFVLVNDRSMRAAYRKFGLHWNTLQKMLDHPLPPGYRRSAAAKPRKIAPFLPVVHLWLAADLANKLTKAVDAGGLDREMRTLAQPKLLILDEVGYLKFDAVQASLLSQVICQLYQRQQATVLTNNKAFGE